MCTCELGYTGKRCQHLIDDCSSRPCQNGGSCIDMLDGFACKCRPGFVGKLFVEIFLFDYLFCFDQFIFHRLDNLFSGLQCEAEIDECLSDPCSPEGTEKCLDLDNKFECQCRQGYTGQLCEVSFKKV